VVVAVAFVHVVPVAIDDIIHVVVVADRLVAAARPVDVLGIMTFADVGDTGGLAHAHGYAPKQEMIPSRSMSWS
jgi:hypothetical protein